MDRHTFRELLSPAGGRALAGAVALAPTEATFLACATALRKAHPPEVARAALEMVLLRAKARAKFARADALFFTREALEQATAEAVARHRARRLAPFGRVADLCCGIGGDALALAEAGATVDAVDTDELRLAMCAANAAALGFAARVRCVPGDALAVPLPEARAAFADPNRRAAGRRFLNPEQYAPALGALRARFAPGFPLAVKVAPGIAHADIPADAEAEFVSLNGELKECVLWFGALRAHERRATVLPSGEALAGAPAAGGDVAPLGAVLLDPDPAVARAELVPLLADRVGARAIDEQVQLLTTSADPRTPFARAFAVECAEPFNVGRLRAYFRARRVGRVTIVKRGSPADADDVMKKLKLEGDGHRTLFLTRAAGAHTAIVCA
jgi:SAM-dependent methyltransferase